MKSIKLATYFTYKYGISIGSINAMQKRAKNLLHSFRDKANALHDCSEDIRLLIREGYDKEIAYRTALNLFGMDTTSFLAIDGTGLIRDRVLFSCCYDGLEHEIEFIDDPIISNEKHGDDNATSMPSSVVSALATFYTDKEGDKLKERLTFHLVPTINEDLNNISKPNKDDNNKKINTLCMRF